MGCTVAESDRIPLGSDSRRTLRHVAVAAGSAGFIVLYTLNEGGFDDLFARLVSIGGEVGAPVALTDNFASERDPALVWTGSQFIAGWHDNDGRGFEVVTRALDTMGTPTAAARTLTTPRMGFLHDSLALTLDEGGVVAAFVEEEILGAGRSLQAARLTDEGALAGEITVLAEAPVNAPVLAARAGGSVALWVRPETEGSRIASQLLDEAAASIGSRRQVSTQTNAAGVVGVARTPSGRLASVFDVDVGGGGARQEIRFRALEPTTGQPMDNEVVISPGTTQGRAPGIAAFAGGYAVAYRATVDPELAEPTIRLVLVTTNGTPTAVTDLDPTTADGGPVRVAIGFDGSILVAWAESTDEGTALVARRLRCGS